MLHVLHDDYPHLSAEYGVKRMGLFGSFARGTANETSDIHAVEKYGWCTRS
ncbi:MAG: nucleotidyltransferase domain-containing protein [Caldilineaceae bacterium]